jgi:hypothetical protein
MPFKAAVRLAVDVLFGFTHRASGGKALWCGTARVWLGRTTFMAWALEDPDMDIPRVVSKAADAPDSTEELREAVQAELVAHWADYLSSLPEKSTPRWAPLP